MLFLLTTRVYRGASNLAGYLFARTAPAPQQKPGRALVSRFHADEVLQFNFVPDGQGIMYVYISIKSWLFSYLSEKKTACRPSRSQVSAGGASSGADIFSLSSIITGEADSHYFKCDHKRTSSFPVDYAQRLRLHAGIGADEMVDLDTLVEKFELQQHLLRIIDRTISTKVTVRGKNGIFA